jgi:hypothetical protein
MYREGIIVLIILYTDITDAREPLCSLFVRKPVVEIYNANLTNSYLSL